MSLFQHVCVMNGVLCAIKHILSKLWDEHVCACVQENTCKCVSVCLNISRKMCESVNICKKVLLCERESS